MDNWIETKEAIYLEKTELCGERLTISISSSTEKAVLWFLNS